MTPEQIAKRLTYQPIAEVPINTRDMLAAHIAIAIKADRKLSGDRRDEVARIVEIVARDGLPMPRDLDAALDAIEQAYLHTPNA